MKINGANSYRRLGLRYYGSGGPSWEQLRLLRLILRTRRRVVQRADLSPNQTGLHFLRMDLHLGSTNPTGPFLTLLPPCMLGPLRAVHNLIQSSWAHEELTRPTAEVWIQLLCCHMNSTLHSTIAICPSGHTAMREMFLRRL